MNSAIEIFLARSRRYLTHEYLPKITSSVARLPLEDLWWRPNPASNSIGNLLLHLAGNLRQWVISGIGQAPDVRQRQEEFDSRAPIPIDELLALLAETVHEADHVLARLEPDRLTETRRIQGKEVTLVEAIYHAVEHFSMHTGQIVYITKLRTGEDLGFYEIVDGVAYARWSDTKRSTPRP